MGGERVGDHSLWDPPRPGHIIQLYSQSYLGGRRRLVSSVQQPAEITAKVVAADKGADQGGCGCLDLGPDILGSGTFSNVVRFGDVGDDPPHWEGVRRIPPQGGPQADGGGQPQQGRDGVWLYPLMEDAMAEAGLQEVQTYVSYCHNTVVQFIVTRPIMDLCLAVENRPGRRMSKRQWQQ